MPPKRHLRIVPYTPENKPTYGVVDDQELIEIAASGLSGASQNRFSYDGNFGGEQDNLSIYLNNVGQHKLLNPDEEVAHALAIKAGKKAESEISQGVYDDGFIGPTELTEDQAKKAVTLGKIANHVMITCNLRLVAQISGSQRYQNKGLSRSDLIQEGFFGLEKAVQKFDPSLGFRFSTYAVPSIRGAIKRAVANQGSTVKIPRHIRDSIQNLNVSTAKLTNQIGREPTVDEIANEAGLSVEDVERLQRDQNVMYTESTSRVRTDGEEYDNEVALIDDTAQIPFEKVLSEVMSENQLEQLLGILDDRQREYLSWRFGLYDGIARTLAEVGRLMGFSKQRSEQIEKKAINKLRILTIDVIGSEDVE